MEIYSYFVVWIDKDKKDRYSSIDIQVDKMDNAGDIHDKIVDELLRIFEETNIVTIKHVSFLKSSK